MTSSGISGLIISRGLYQIDSERLESDMVYAVTSYFYERVMLLLPVLCLVISSILTPPCGGQEDTGRQPRY